MKKLLFILLFVSLIFSCTEKKQRNFPVNGLIWAEVLNGEIKTVKLTKFSIIERNGEDQRKKILLKNEVLREDSMIFNSLGYMIKLYDLQTESVSINLYDEENRLIERGSYDFEGNYKIWHPLDERVRTVYEWEEEVVVKSISYNMSGDSVSGELKMGDKDIGPWGTLPYQYGALGNSNEKYVYKEYDEQENWRRRETFVDGNQTEVTEREIEYYE